MQERGFGVLGMERAAAHVAAARAADDHRRREPGAIARGRDVIGQHVVGARDEVDELHFGDGAQSHVGRTGRRAHNRSFGDGRIDDARLAEALAESLGDLERTPVQTDVLPQDEDAFVALHLLPETLA